MNRLGLALGLPAMGTGAFSSASNQTKFVGMLDEFEGSDFAVDTRVLSADFLHSPIVRIRRSADDNHCDVLADLSQKVNNNYWISLDSPVQNFSSSSDATTLGEFVASAGYTDVDSLGGAADGFVRTIFDQSGNSRDAENATSTDQPKIVDAGALVDGFTFDGVDDVLDFDPLDVIGEAFSLFFVGDSDIPVIGSGGPSLWIGPRRTSNDIREAGLIDGTNQADFNFDAGTYGSGKYTASFYGDSSDSFSARVNGVPSNNNPIAVIGQTSPVNVIRNLMMRTTSDFRSGNVNGCFFFPSELTVDQISAIEANIAEAHP